MRTSDRHGSAGPARHPARLRATASGRALRPRRRDGPNVRLNGRVSSPRLARWPGRSASTAISPHEARRSRRRRAPRCGSTRRSGRSSSTASCTGCVRRGTQLSAVQYVRGDETAALAWLPRSVTASAHRGSGCAASTRGGVRGQGTAAATAAPCRSTTGSTPVSAGTSTPGRCAAVACESRHVVRGRRPGAVRRGVSGWDEIRQLTRCVNGIPAGRAEGVFPRQSHPKLHSIHNGRCVRIGRFRIARPGCKRDGNRP